MPSMSAASAASTSSAAKPFQLRAGSAPSSTWSAAAPGPVTRVVDRGSAAGAEDRGARPLEPPRAVVADHDGRPGELVVEVELGVDRGDLDELEPLGEELRRPGRRLAGVVPPLEGDDEQSSTLESGRLIHSWCPAFRPGRPGSPPQ